MFLNHVKNCVFAVQLSKQTVQQLVTTQLSTYT